jgi:pyruvate/2-oxoglutarate dehydrogenase complex dihydrolipoamide dehydrogenase (E3) component
MIQHLVIGGSDAGISGALRIKEIDPKAAVTVMAADAMTRKGMVVTLMEFAPEVLTTLESELGSLIRAELHSNGVRVITGQAVQRISRNENGLSVHPAAGDAIAADMVLVAAGARPSTELAQTAGIGL